MTLAARFDVLDTDRLVALAMAAFRSKLPVIVIAPKPPSVAPPTIPLNSTSLVPTFKVNPRVSVAALLTISLKVIWLSVVVKVRSPPDRVTAPV